MQLLAARSGRQFPTHNVRKPTMADGEIAATEVKARPAKARAR
jgi:hypothetical protein